MQTTCVRCHKAIDSVQGYKFSPTEYVCMSCYDEFRAERVAKAKKQHKNPLIDQYGAEGSRPAPTPPPQSRPAQPQAPAAPQSPAAPQPAAPQDQGTFAPKAPPAAPQAQASPPPAGADICDICKKPIADFAVPLSSGKNACTTCNDILRDVAKSMMVNAKCPSCGAKISPGDI